MPDRIPTDLVVRDETVPAGAYWTGVIRRWATLRVTDLEGQSGAALLAFNAAQTSERYNAPDTTKVQNTIFLRPGWVLLSDLGRVLLSITGGSAPAHETLAGGTTAATVRARHGGGGRYLEARNGRYTNAHDNFVAALGRHGLDKRDIVPNVNLFSRVEVTDGGALRWIAGASFPGAWIDLRAELDVLVAVSVTPHVLDPTTEWAPGPLQLTVWRSPPPTSDDECRTRSPEAIRAFENTDAWWQERQ